MTAPSSDSEEIKQLRQRIKELGVAAREALTELFGVEVHLSLLVKIAPAWTNVEAGLRRFGYRGES